MRVVYHLNKKAVQLRCQPSTFFSPDYYRIFICGSLFRCKVCSTESECVRVNVNVFAQRTISFDTPRNTQTQTQTHCVCVHIVYVFDQPFHLWPEYKCKCIRNTRCTIAKFWALHSFSCVFFFLYVCQFVGSCINMHIDWIVLMFIFLNKF